jgi:hypothetical protein
LIRARLARLAGAALLECGELSRARTKLLESRGLFHAITDAGSFLSDSLPDIELTRLECIAGRRVHADEHAAAALHHLGAFQAQIVGVSRFAQAYVSELVRSLEGARAILGDTEPCRRGLSDVLGRIPY